MLFAMHLESKIDFNCTERFYSLFHRKMFYNKHHFEKEEIFFLKIMCSDIVLEQKQISMGGVVVMMVLVVGGLLKTLDVLEGI